MLRPGDLVDERYRLGRQIGTGGMAAVFEVFDVTLNRRVAAKFLNNENRNQATVERRFLREARIAAAVRHTNVVEVFDFGVQDGTPYMIMELLEGMSLAGRANEPPLMTVRELLDVAEEVLAGLAAVHEAGIIHRDIKPENIFLARTTGHEVVPKVFDFGVSRITTSEGAISAATTVEGYLVGTPHYMSSEQARGQKELDATTDVYSLGVVLYEFLTGRLPFDAELMGDLVIAIATATPKSVYEVRPELGHAISDFIDRAMSKLSEDRFATAAEMRDALRALRAESPELDELKTRLVTRADEKLEETVDGPGASVPLPWDRAPMEVDYALPDEPVPEATPPAPARSTSPMLAAAAVFALVALGAGGWWLARDEPAPPPSASPPSASPPTSTAPIPEIEEPTTVTVRLTGVPAGAELHLDDRLARGSEMTLERGESEHELRVDAEGMEPFALVFAATEDRTLAVEMTPLALPEVQPTPPVVATGRRRRGQRRTGEGGASSEASDPPPDPPGPGIFRSPDF